jgi:hypothetical protein
VTAGPRDGQAAGCGRDSRASARRDTRRPSGRSQASGSGAAAQIDFQAAGVAYTVA